MSSAQVSLAREQLYALLQEVRKEAVPLVDAFDYPDRILNSALGRYDGDVYTHLYKWAQEAPRNRKQVNRISSCTFVRNYYVTHFQSKGLSSCFSFGGRAGGYSICTYLVPSPPDVGCINRIYSCTFTKQVVFRFKACGGMHGCQLYICYLYAVLVASSIMPDCSRPDTGP